MTAFHGRRPAADPARAAPAQPVIAYLGLGANLGDRADNLRRAVALLAATPGIRLRRLSSVYETEPVGYRDQPRFLNQVAEVETDLAPQALLACARAVEAALGRTRGVRWGPRTMDVDILLYDEVSLAEPDLVLPHPRLTERAFVLVPLAEIAPALVLPGGRTAAELAAGALAAGAGVKRL